MARSNNTASVEILGLSEHAVNRWCDLTLSHFLTQSAEEGDKINSSSWWHRFNTATSSLEGISLLSKSPIIRAVGARWSNTIRNRNHQSLSYQGSLMSQSHRGLWRYLRDMAFAFCGLMGPHAFALWEPRHPGAFLQLSDASLTSHRLNFGLVEQVKGKAENNHLPLNSRLVWRTWMCGVDSWVMTHDLWASRPAIRCGQLGSDHSVSW